MITRRTLLSSALSSAALLSATAVGGTALGLPSAAAAVRRLPVDLVHRRRGKTVYAVVSGIDRASGRWFFLAADGRTKIFADRDAAPMTPLGRSVAIKLAAAGRPRRIVVPPMDSGRISFSVDRPLQFFVNPGGGVATPSVTNPSDPNRSLDWGFCELSLDRFGLYANISFVDFVGLPIGLRLRTPGGTQTVGGLRRDGLARIAAGLRRQGSREGSGWGRLVVTERGRPLRVLSPNLAAVGGPDPLAGYLDPYIAQVWRHYRSHDLVIDTQSAWGRVTGRVGADGLLRFRGVGSFRRPSSAAVFNCSTAPFATSNDAMGNVSARLAAALNRTTLLANARQPDVTAGRFYRTARTNHYARLVHANTAGGAGYAFPYDDVHGGGFNAEGRVVAPKPTLLTITVG
ncbi:hypothetical protein FHX74_001763 [Friedmanniella endophytica]|uniref:GH64 domain-containing protein n=1 Tax=Microlunatus kandeliicorticis TaxID=1759536 RepID=A0A7W3P5Q3_9ACTN|nr:beta-1,3-glucanase family protein [Microlunatus kandeliicorticis]MBA8794158.1 hypothetical protein [Microlunatus kandeliicorticis]